MFISPGFASGAVVKSPPANAGDTVDVGSIPGSGRFPGKGNGNPLQYSSLANSMDRGDWWATVHGVTKSQTLLIYEALMHVHLSMFLNDVHDAYKFCVFSVQKQNLIEHIWFYRAMKSHLG